ncbi:DUF5330 domain-containing protein [Coralliovum pocilloporae]|uniref:DUF5330 domain-containing protein n=1 Tax=Coralliovum pocilloporae TaxID=3066369 RepID=UPI0033071A62
MFLLKTAFWLSLVILFLPAYPSDDGGEQNRVSTLQALSAAQATVDDFSGFCERNPGPCETGRSFMNTFAAKAKYGVKLVYDFIDEPSEPPASAPSPSAPQGPEGLETSTQALS